METRIEYRAPGGRREAIAELTMTHEHGMLGPTHMIDPMSPHTPAPHDASGAVPAALPPNETERLRALLDYEILDSLPEQSYLDLVLLASRICEVPMALIGLIDDHRQWFKARVGLDGTQTPRDLTFCAHALLQPDRVMEVPDALHDPRFARHPMVLGAPGIRFYAGVPLLTESGHALGTLCAIDSRPRQLRPDQVEGLRALARQVMELLNLRRALLLLKRTQSDLERSERRFRFMAQSVPEVIWTAGPDGRLDFVSERARQQHGATPENLLGEGWRDGVLLEDQPRIDAAWQQARERGENLSVQLRLRCADGSFRWHQCRAVPLKDADGRTLKWFGSNTDIEDTLRAKELAESAARARSAFLSTMSHEIRTPMNAVLGFAGLLAETPLNAQQREFVQAIRGSGDHLIGLINDILDYSKIESGGLRLERAPFDVRRLVETAVELVSQPAQAKDVELVVNMEPGTPARCEADATRMRQVLVNLLGNAVKFTPAGSVCVNVRATERADGLAEFCFEVRDTGIGISAEAQSRLFLEFSQAETSTARRFGGTGLGLAISKRIVEAHAGRIEVDSEPGQGSCFRVFITARATRVVEPVADTLRGRRVLLVEDHDAQRAALSQMLGEWGLLVEGCADGPAALERVQRQPVPEVLLIDQTLPESGGIALAVALRRKASVPAVLLSALGADRPQESLFTALVAKPVRRQRLHDALVQAIQGGAGDVPAPGVESRPQAAPLSILLAEDNLTNRKLATLLLRKLGHPSVDVAEDGQQAVEAVERRDYDLVLMDVEMPGLDGLEATRRIRAERPADRQPLIAALTANVLPEDRERCRTAGMDEYLAKPIDLAQLSAVLQRAAARRRPAEPPLPA